VTALVGSLGCKVEREQHRLYVGNGRGFMLLGAQRCTGRPGPKQQHARRRHHSQADLGRAPAQPLGRPSRQDCRPGCGPRNARLQRRNDPHENLWGVLALVHAQRRRLCACHQPARNQGRILLLATRTNGRLRIASYRQAPREDAQQMAGPLQQRLASWDVAGRTAASHDCTLLDWTHARAPSSAVQPPQSSISL
jgi:hypothetical protein